MRCLWGDFLDHSSSRVVKSLVQWCVVAFLVKKCLSYVHLGMCLGDNLTFRSSSVRKTLPLLKSWFASMSLWGQIWTRKLSFVPGGKSGLPRIGVSGLSHGVGFVALFAFLNIASVGPIRGWCLVWVCMWCGCIHGRDLKVWGGNGVF